jgi:DivIVA domain-containing protein
VLGFLVFVLGILVVGGLLFLGASWLLGRGETQPPADLDRSPVELPDDRPVTADDVRALQISVALRGYRMTEVDWLIDQFARTLEERDAAIASLRARAAHPETTLAPKDGANPTTPGLVVPPPAQPEHTEERPDA